MKADHLSIDLRTRLRFFAFYYANGTLRMDILKDIEYREKLQFEASIFEMVMAIYTNNILLDENGKVINDTYAQERAAKYIRSECDQSYEVVPPFEEWEITLHFYS